MGVLNENAEYVSNNADNYTEYVKIFSIPTSYWQVSYADVENGDSYADGNLNNYTKTFNRMSEASHTELADLGALINGVAKIHFEANEKYDRGMSSTETLVSEDDEPEESFILTNIGITKESDSTSKKVDSNYVPKKVNGFGSFQSDINWMIDVDGTKWDGLTEEQTGYLNKYGGIKMTGKSNGVNDYFLNNGYYNADSGYFQNSSTIVYGIYKPEKSLNFGNVYEDEDGNVKVLDDYGSMNLNVYTTQYDYYVPPYISNGNDDVELKIKEFRILKWSAKRDRSLGDDVDNGFSGFVEEEVTWNTSDLTVGEEVYSCSTACAKGVRIQGQRTFVVAVYEMNKVPDTEVEFCDDDMMTYLAGSTLKGEFDGYEVERLGRERKHDISCNISCSYNAQDKQALQRPCNLL